MHVPRKKYPAVDAMLATAMAGENTAAVPDCPDPHRENVAGKPESAWLPFPVEAPPRRSLLQGYLLSLSGTLLVIAAFFGGGLAANGIVWFVIDLFHPVQLPIPSAAVAMVCVLAVPIGAASPSTDSVTALASGALAAGFVPGMRER